MIKRVNSRPHLHGAVIHNGVVYAAGHAASNIELDMAGQMREICDKLDALLAACGSDKSGILQARIYLTDMSKKAEMNEVWVNWIPAENLPARAAIGVADLGDPRRLVEVVITAAVA